MRPPARTGRVILGLALLGPVLGGCVNIMETSAKAKPEWFEAAAREVKGEGYPELREAPNATIKSGAEPTWAVEAKALQAEGDKLRAQIATSDPIATPEEIRARAAQLRALTEQGKSTPQTEASPAQP